VAIQQNRFPEAIVAAAGTSTTIGATNKYAVAMGELAIATDTQVLYIADSNYRFTKAALWILPDVMCHDGEILVDLNGDIVIRGY
jgi:hypothetical protein